MKIDEIIKKYPQHIVCCDFNDEKIVEINTLTGKGVYLEKDRFFYQELLRKAENDRSSKEFIKFDFRILAVYKLQQEDIDV